MRKSELQQLTVTELKSLARKMKIPLPSGARKETIISVLAASETPAEAGRSAAAAGRNAVAKKSTKGPAAGKRTAKKATTVKKGHGTHSGTPGLAPETPHERWKFPPGIEEPLMAQERVEISKFYTGPVQPAPSLDTYHELPQGYGEDQITIMARDPMMAYAYWEVTPARLEREKSWFGWDSTLCVRVYDITGVQFNGSNAQGYYDQEISDRIGSWYFGIGRPGHSFAADIGLRTPAGRFLTLARSNFITMPRDGASDVIDEEWSVTEEEFWRMYGIGEGLSSLEVGERWRQRLRHGLFSPGMRSRKEGGK